MSDSPANSVQPTTDQEAATYIAEMCAELRTLAQRQQFRVLAYLLDMSRLEACLEAERAPRKGRR